MKYLLLIYNDEAAAAAATANTTPDQQAAADKTLVRLWRLAHREGLVRSRRRTAANFHSNVGPRSRRQAHRD